MNSLKYGDYTNEEIASVVAYAISEDCEKARRRFTAEFEKEAPLDFIKRNSSSVGRQDH